MHLLEVKGLSKTYSKKVVIRNIDLNVTTGEIVGLLGPNGAGKTTTFYSILGVVKPDRGNIYLDGIEISRLPMYKRALMGISYLPQEPSIFRKLSVEDNLRAVLEIRGASGRRDGSRGRPSHQGIQSGGVFKEEQLQALGRREASCGDSQGPGHKTHVYTL